MPTHFVDELQQELFNRNQWETKRKFETVVQLKLHDHDGFVKRKGTQR